MESLLNSNRCKGYNILHNSQMLMIQNSYISIHLINLKKYLKRLYG